MKKHINTVVLLVLLTIFAASSTGCFIPVGGWGRGGGWGGGWHGGR
jgi:hypothetical protein